MGYRIINLEIYIGIISMAYFRKSAHAHRMKKKYIFL